MPSVCRLVRNELSGVLLSHESAGVNDPDKHQLFALAVAARLVSADPAQMIIEATRRNAAAIVARCTQVP